MTLGTLVKDIWEKTKRHATLFGAGAILAGAIAVAEPAVNPAYAVVPMSGMAVNHQGNGVNGIPVTANQAGQPDSTNTIPTYLMFDETSSVPEDPAGPQIQQSSWGKIKFSYSQPIQSRPVEKSKTLAKMLFVLPDNTLRFDGETDYFNIEHYFGDIQGDNYTFNVMMVPRNYQTATIGPTEIDVEAVKAFYQVGIYGDNLFWSHERAHTYPMPILIRQNVTQAKLDSLQSRIDLNNAELGRQVFVIGNAVYGQYGIVWDTESFQNSTTPDLYDGTLEIRSMKIRTLPGVQGYDDFRVALHEMARTLGIVGVIGSNEYGGEYGHLYTDYAAPTEKAWVVIDVGLSKQEQTEAGQNNATMQEWHQ